MWFLAACIFCSALLYIVFKAFEKYKIDLLQAIVVNYIVAGGLGFVFAGVYGQGKTLNYLWQSDWSVYAIIIGLMFITIFNLMGISSQKSGVSVTSVANKMSVVLPVVFGFIFLNELVTGVKIIGICLAIVALYFTTHRTEKKERSHLLFPLIIFFASGVLDIILGYCSKTLVDPNETIIFTACLFSIAAMLGMIWLVVLLIAGKQKIKGKNIVAGIVLGIPNFGSILFVFEGLRSTQWDVSVFYPVLNMGVVILASILGWLFYKEKLSYINSAGIVLAALAIYLISLQ